ncbi:MAG TPA: family 78 glycoside hydrolase catalytic domain [Acidobacteriaceae bacterium]
MRALASAVLLILVHVAFAEPVHMRTNAREEPIGIDTAKPLFSWESSPSRPNWKQSAYEILVATDGALLTPGKADVWDSGRIASAESVNIPFSGKALQAQKHYVWAVRVWDNKESAGPWAKAGFETGLLAASDWKAQWIMRKDPAAEAEINAVRWIWLAGVDTQHVPFGSSAHFLYRLHLEEKPQAGSLHMLASASAVARVNGHVTGHHDHWGAFDREEITDLLHAGENEIELDCISQRGNPSAGSSRAAVAVAIHVTDASGKERRIVSDGSWSARANASDAWSPVQVVGPISLPYGQDTSRRPGPGPDRVSTDASLFRKDFAVGKKVVSARLSITALGAYEAYLNGKRVAPGTLLAPGWTDFRKRVEFQTYDVTGLLSPGTNTLAAMLGGGWHSSPMTWSGVRVTPGPDLLRAQLDLTLADGTHQTVATDESWLTAASPISFSEIYGGEAYDARLLHKDWASPGASASGWAHASAGDLPNPSIALMAQPDLPIRNTIVLKPKAIDPANAAHPAVFDMGQNMVGNIRLHAKGVRGSVVRMRFAERLNPDGSIYTENLRNADATDTYIFSGDGDETYTPSFTFHGFRYVELSGVDSPTLGTIEGLVYNSLPDKPAVRLVSSSETLNKMNELGVWGQRGNFVSIPTDCPQRDERLGWMGDAGAFWRTGSFNFDIQPFSHKFVLDIEDAQTPAGEFTDVSPNILAPNAGAPGWGDAGIFIPYTTWLQYGDTAIMEQAWPAMERWMANILEHNPNYLRQHNLGANYGDWLAPDPNTPKDLIGTAYWALTAREMAEMAAALHRTDGERKYRELYGHIADAFRAAYIRPDGSVSGNTQTAYLATLFTAIAPKSLEANMVDRLVKDIAAHGDHLSTGFLGTPFLLSVLDQHHEVGLAFKLLLADTYPSWGYMVKKGATTWWERWNGDTGDPGMNSYNHYAFGSVMAWVYRRAAGIDTDAMGPGYRHLSVEPHFDPALPQLHVEYDSAYGPVVSDWQASSRTFTIVTPPNTTASIVLPDGRRFEVGSGSHRYRIR